MRTVNFELPKNFVFRFYLAKDEKVARDYDLGLEPECTHIQFGILPTRH